METASVVIPKQLHSELKRECKSRMPRVNLGDRVAQLIRLGQKYEAKVGSKNEAA